MSTEPTVEQVERIEADVVVVGAGASGITAALAAAERGAQVVLLEKADKPGGAGLFGTEGLLAVGSKQQIEAGEDITVQKVLTTLLDYTHNRSNGALGRAIIEQSAAVIDWLASYGVETRLSDNAQYAHKDLPRIYHRYVDKPAGYASLLGHLAEKGGWVLTGTTPTRILEDDDGAVAGIEAAGTDGTQVRIDTRAVVIATGGYAANDEFLTRTGEVPAEAYVNIGWENNVGDGYRIATEAGARTQGLGEYLLHSALVGPRTGHLSTRSASRLVNLPLLWVNQQGDRFVNEDAVYDFALWGNAAYGVGGHYYTIVDSATVQELREQGSDLIDSFATALRETTPVSDDSGEQLVTVTADEDVLGTLPDLDESLAEAIEHEVAWRADDLPGLAAAIGADTDVLVASVEQYNRAVKAGQDDAFYVPKEYLRHTVEEGPFYAVKARVSILSTGGGVSVSPRLEVLGTDLRPIRGLYAVGNDAGGLYAGGYPTFEGLAAAFAYGSGLIAGHQAAAWAKKAPA